MITSTTCIGTHTCIRLYHEIDITRAHVRRMCGALTAYINIYSAYTDTASQRGRASTNSARTASQRSAATNKIPFSSSPFCRPLPRPCPPALTTVTHFTHSNTRPSLTTCTPYLALPTSTPFFLRVTCICTQSISKTTSNRETWMVEAAPVFAGACAIRALISAAIVMKACSTFVESFAEVSRKGIPVV